MHKSAFQWNFFEAYNFYQNSQNFICFKINGLKVSLSIFDEENLEQENIENETIEE